MIHHQEYNSNQNPQSRRTTSPDRSQPCCHSTTKAYRERVSSLSRVTKVSVIANPASQPVWHHARVVTKIRAIPLLLASQQSTSYLENIKIQEEKNSRDKTTALLYGGEFKWKYQGIRVIWVEHRETSLKCHPRSLRRLNRRLMNCSPLRNLHRLRLEGTVF